MSPEGFCPVCGHPHCTRSHGGRYGLVGWLALAGYVAVWDHYAPETLTSAFKVAHRHHRHRYLVRLGYAVTTAHLFGLLPRRVDPFYWVVDRR